MTIYPDPTPLTLDIPSNLPVMDIPVDNPLTVEGVALGRRLFYDKRLSADNTQSCGSCHAQAYGFSDNGKQFSLGIDGLEGNMNAMAIINPGWSNDFFWDGRERGLENQARRPVTNPIEMHENWENVVTKLQSDPDYRDRFGYAFGTTEITEDLVVKAIAQFERTLVSGNSDYDRFYRNEPVSITQSQFNGFTIFFTEKGDCFHCHGFDLLMDNDFHNNGLDSVFTDDNFGRYKVTGNPNDIGRFKTPTLRNIELTGPYMHDGRFQTLEEVVEHYNSGVVNSATVDPLVKPQGLGLTVQEKADLVEFLKMLTDTTFINDPSFFDPWN